MINSRLSFQILLLIIILIPLFIFPWADDSYLIPKFTLLNLGILFIIFILFIQHPNFGFRTSNNSEFGFASISCFLPLASYFLLFIFLLNAVSLVYATSFPLALRETEKWLFLVLLYFIFIAVIWTEKQVKQIISVLLLSGLLTSIWVILQDYHISLFRVIPRLPDWRGFLVAGLGNSDYVAGFLVSIFPLAFTSYAVVQDTKQKIFLIITLCLMYAALIITFSVGANTGLILGMILVFLLSFSHGLTLKGYNREQTLRGNRWVILFLLFALITAFYVLPIPVNGRGESIFTQAFSSNRWKEGGNTRLVIWANTWELIKSHPLRGVGAGNFTDRYLDYLSPAVTTNPHLRMYAGEYTNAAHNELLHTWAELGIPGLITLILLIISFYYSAMKIVFIPHPSSFVPRIMLGAVGGFTAMLIYGMMSYPLHLPATAMLFIFYLSLPKILSETKDETASCHPVVLSSSQPHQLAIYYLLATIVFLLLAVWLLRPLIADTYFRRGKEALQQHNDTAAFVAFTKSTQWDNFHADAHYHLGELELRNMQIDMGDKNRLLSAIQEFELARQSRNDKYLLYDLGVAYLLAERYQDAVNCFLPLTRRQPDNPDYWDRLSFVYLKLGKLELSNDAHIHAEEIHSNLGR